MEIIQKASTVKLVGCLEDHDMIDHSDAVN